MKALGMIEVKGRLAAIEALDSALKTANVYLLNMIRVGGGLTTVLVEGDVGAVKVAVAAGAASAQKVGDLIASHVIPRPAVSVRAMLSMALDEPPVAVLPVEQALAEDSAAPPNDADEVICDGALNARRDAFQIAISDDLEAKSVNALRTLARSTEGIRLTKKEIKFAKKDELIEAIRCAKS